MATKRRRYWIGRLVRRPKRLIRFKATPRPKLGELLACGGEKARREFTAIKVSRRLAALPQSRDTHLIVEIMRRQWWNILPAGETIPRDDDFLNEKNAPRLRSVNRAVENSAQGHESSSFPSLISAASAAS